MPTKRKRDKREENSNTAREKEVFMWACNTYALCNRDIRSTNHLSLAITIWIFNTVIPISFENSCHVCINKQHKITCLNEYIKNSHPNNSSNRVKHCGLDVDKWLQLVISTSRLKLLVPGMAPPDMAGVPGTATVFSAGLTLRLVVDPSVGLHSSRSRVLPVWLVNWFGAISRLSFIGDALATGPRPSLTDGVSSLVIRMGCKSCTWVVAPRAEVRCTVGPPPISWGFSPLWWAPVKHRPKGEGLSLPTQSRNTPRASCLHDCLLKGSLRVVVLCLEQAEASFRDRRAGRVWQAHLQVG